MEENESSRICAGHVSMFRVTRVMEKIQELGIKTTREGFEPSLHEGNRLAVCRLNHSATSSVGILVYGQKGGFVMNMN